MPIDRLTGTDQLMRRASRTWPQDNGALAILDGASLLDSGDRLRIDALAGEPKSAPESFPASRARRLLALSGFVMLGFVCVHLAGNLLAFGGAAPFNAYARLVARSGGVHLLPGTWTGLRSLGLIRPRTVRLASIVSPAVALVVTLGLSAAPLAVLLGVLR